MLALELGIIAILIVVNGLLAMSELAIVSSRPARLAALVEKGASGSRRALTLASDPGKFLSTVQIGITLVGVLSGAVSGATLGLRLTSWLVEIGVPQGAADIIGVGLVVTLITYASLIVGELVPKQIALRDPEAIALKVAPAMTLLAKDFLAARVPARSLRQGPAVAARPSRQEGRKGHRGRDPHADRRSGECRRARAGREGDDRGRDAARRPAGRRGDDAAARRQHDRSHRRLRCDPRSIRRKPAFAPSRA